jgi:hypothetical protein
MARFTQSGSGDGSGTPGPQGPAGADGADGADALWNFLGEWVNGVDYAAGSVVQFEGSSYYHPDGQYSSYSPPTNGWLLVSSKGDTGEQGEQGEQGLEGPPGAEYSTYLVRNNTGSTILKGTLVSAVGAEPSGRIDIQPFAAVGGIDTELRVMGIVMDNLTTGINGTVMSFGTLTGLDTRGTSASGLSVGDETWAAGDILFAHPTVAGKLTKVRPQHDLPVAFITIRHASAGQIAIRIFPGNHHLEWLHDVEIDSPTENEVLAFDITSGLWKNQTAAEAGLQALEDTGWISVTSFSNSFSGTNVAYRKINNVVYLRGRIGGGTTGQTAFILPTGYRPSTTEVVIPAQEYGTSNMTYVTVGTDGSVYPNSTAAWLSSMIFPVG